MERFKNWIRGLVVDTVKALLPTYDFVKRAEVNTLGEQLNMINMLLTDLTSVTKKELDQCQDRINEFGQTLGIQVANLKGDIANYRITDSSIINNNQRDLKEIGITVEALSAKINNPLMVVPVKKLVENAKLPSKSYKDDAGWDVYATERTYLGVGDQAIVKTGIAMEIPSGWHVQVHTRSSHGKNMIKCHLGIVDSGYRNEILVLVHNYGYRDGFEIKPGDKICQLIFSPVPNIELQEVRELGISDRGEKGFGSSGR